MEPWQDGLQYIHNYLYLLAFEESCSPHTLKAYKKDLSQAFFLEFLDLEMNSSPPERILSDLEASDLLARAREAQSRWSHLSPASRNRKTATLKSFFGWMHSKGFIERDLASLLSAPKVPQRLPKHISADEAIALLRFLEKELSAATGPAPHLDPSISPDLISLVLIALLYGGGLRVSEACGLETKNLNWSKNTCLVRGKGSKERLVALPAFTMSTLKAMLEKQKSLHAGHPTRYVFGEDPLSPRRAYELVRKAGLRAGLLKPLHPHALRHSYATHLLRSGANLRVLQALLGHSSLQATSRYTHVGLDELARTLESHSPLKTRKA